MRPVVVAGAVTATILVWSALVVAETWVDRRSERAGLEALIAQTEIGVQQVLWGRSR